MRGLWKIVGIAALLAILGVAAVGAAAYAQEAEDESTSPFDFVAKFKETLADILGITVDEYDAAVDKAKEQVVDEAVADGWLTEEQGELFRWRMEQAPDSGMRGMRKAFGMFGRTMSRMALGPGDNLLSVAADALDMKLTELLTELQDGKSIAEVAEDKGVDAQTIVDAYAAELKADLDEAVADGDMTQRQADYYLERTTERAADQLDKEWGGGFWRSHRDRMKGFPGLDGF